MEEKKFINPFTDVGFKILFGQESVKGILIAFLNDIFQGERVITDLTYLDKEKVRTHSEDRTILYDLLCETDTGEQIIVEMQNNWQLNFADRSIYYVSRSISMQGESGRSWEYRLKPVYGIFLMNFDLSDMRPALRHDAALVDLATGEIFSDRIRLIYLNLKQMNKKEEECVNNLERWIYILKNMEHLRNIPFKDFIPVLPHFEEVANYHSLQGEERNRYDRALKNYRDARASLRGSYIQGWDKGVAEGREEGREEGRAEGRAETALNLLKLGVDKETIAKATGLGVDEIEALKLNRE